MTRGERQRSSEVVLAAMVDRLVAAMTGGPAMNCRPRSSRQRIDLAALAALEDAEPADVLAGLLGEKGKARVRAAVDAPPSGVLQRAERKRKRPVAGETTLTITFDLNGGDVRRDAASSPDDDESADEPDPLTPEEREAVRRWDRQKRALAKLRAMAEDARDHERDTGVASLAIGYPLLSLPPSARLSGSGVGRRVLAPIAFIPVNLSLAAGGGGGRVELACRGEGAGRVVPNDTLLLWLAGQCGLDATEEVELFDDPDGTDPHRELDALVRHVAELVAAQDVPDFTQDAELLVEAPTAAEADEDGKPRILRSAVLGLFPASNQGLLRDAQAMVAGGVGDGPARAFVDPAARLTDESAAQEAGTPLLATRADPCQARAVALARSSRCLVVHGPPGTGKSQTIANVIGDHLARGERVLFVSDKRTALDVVHDRLEHLGLGDLCAIVHDPRRDRTTLYKALRDQLETLGSVRPGTTAARQLEHLDERLAATKDDLNARRDALLAISPEADPPVSLHTLIGRWLAAVHASGGQSLRARTAEALGEVRPRELEAAIDDLEATLERGRSVGWAANPWRGVIGLSLDELIDAGGQAAVRRRADALLALLRRADEVADADVPAFDGKGPLTEQVAARAKLLDGLGDVEGLDPAWSTVLKAKTDERQRAAQRLARVAPHAAILRQTPPDAATLAKARTIPAAEANARLERLRQLEHEAKVAAGAVVAAREAGGPDAGACAAAWLSRPRESRDAARRLLDGVTGLAEAVGKNDVDPVLVNRLCDANFSAGELTQRRLAVASYAAAATGVFGFLAFAKKKQAAPTLAALGLPADAASAGRAVPVLDAAQAEADLRSQVAKLDGPEPRVDDAAGADRAIHVLMTHRAALAALDADGPVPLARPDGDLLAMLPSAEAGREVANHLGCDLNPAGVTTAKAALKWVVAADGVRRTRTAVAPGAGELNDAALAYEHASATRLLSAVAEVAPLACLVAEAVEQDDLPKLRRGLVASAARGKAVAAVETSLGTDGMFTARWQIGVANRLRSGGSATEDAERLRERAGDVEDVVRVSRSLATLPPAVATAAGELFEADVEVDAARAMLRCGVFDGEIRRRLAAAGDAVRQADGREIDDLVDRVREMTDERAALVRGATLDLWHGRQQDRLMSASGTRLNSDAADLRRRLAIRGKKVMRLRQLVAAGASMQGGDPLFDLRPVWMASPETIAQIFPREPLFDVIVFDEASQVRLEEALPVMTRARRVVIAGDPKQLPPTRFFESAVAASEVDDPETDDELFEQQQSETEDLLTAALALDVDEAFLDVHYRSRNADLIAFSNDHFYGGRLQPIPGHPANVTPYPPLRLYRAQGTYADRANEAEAGQVVRIVRDLLKWAEPPSIGIACFNLPQRDLILEKLDEAAAGDGDFGRRLAVARERTGEGGFEGLFVKNLESVQGDERDHMVISTTYGPNGQGKFRRNFGPVSQGGGGRRLNVLVTRARHEVHLVTSIPADEYASLPPVPAGQQPTGRWLLYAYLHYAAALEEVYATPDSGDQETVVLASGRTDSASVFVDALAAGAAGGARGVHTYWGGDGLGIDLILGQYDPKAAAEQAEGRLVHATPIGMLADLARHVPAGDGAEWDSFRRGVHLFQGWNLTRIWSPQVYRKIKTGDVDVLS